MLTFDKIDKVACKLADEYYHLSFERRSELYDNFSIDSGTDYARRMLDELIVTPDGEYIW